MKRLIKNKSIKLRSLVVLLLVAGVIATGLYMLGNSRATTGAPSITSPGNFDKRACARTYALSGMQPGSGGDPTANGNRFRSVLNAATPGDCIQVAPGTYRIAGIVDFTKPDITLQGMGTKAEDVTFDHATTPTEASFRIKAGGVHFYMFRHYVSDGSIRSDKAQAGEGNIWA